MQPQAPHDKHNSFTGDSLQQGRASLKNRPACYVFWAQGTDPISRTVLKYLVVVYRETNIPLSLNQQPIRRCQLPE